MVGGAAAAFIYWFFIEAHHCIAGDDPKEEEEQGPLSPTVKALIPESGISTGEKVKDSEI